MNVTRVLPQDRPALIIPMDHGLTMGNLSGLQDPAALLGHLLDAGVDGTLMSPGLAKQLGSRCKAGGMSLTLTLDYQLWSDRAGEVESISEVSKPRCVARSNRAGICGSRPGNTK